MCLARTDTTARLSMGADRSGWRARYPGRRIHVDGAERHTGAARDSVAQYRPLGRLAGPRRRGHFSARAIGEFVPDRPGTWELGLASAGQARLFLDDRLLVVSSAPDAYYRQGSTEVTAQVELEAGSSHRLVAEFTVDSGIEMAGLRIGARPVPPADAQQRAVQAAAQADVVLVLVGYDGAWESEGADRPHMDLPGQQDDLIRAVAAANPHTVVVVNARKRGR